MWKQSKILMKNNLGNIYFSHCLSTNSILYFKIFVVIFNTFVFMLLSLVLLHPSIVGMWPILLKCATLWTCTFTNTCHLWNPYFTSQNQSFIDIQLYEVFCFPWHCWSLQTDRSEWIQTQSECFPWIQTTCSMCFCSLIWPTRLVSHLGWKSCQGLHLSLTSARCRKANELYEWRGIICDFYCSINLFHWMK